MTAANPVTPLGSHELLIFVLQAGVLLGLALVFGRLAGRVGLPAVIGELTAGLLAGPSILGHLAPGLSGWLLPADPTQMHLLDAVAEVGVLLLVGLTGAHLDLPLVRRMGATGIRISIAGVVLPLAFGLGTAALVPDQFVPDSTNRQTFALFLAVAMAVSAIPVIAKTLADMGLLHRTVGQLILCAAMVDDVIGWILLSVVSAMTTGGGGMINVALAFVGLAVVAVVALLVRPLARMIIRSLGRSDDSQAVTAFVVVFILLSAALTQSLRLEAVFGAFVGGIVISSVGVKLRQLTALRGTVASVLAPLYFATVGLRMDLGALAHLLVLTIGVAVLLAAVVGKFLGAYIGARFSRLAHWEAIAIGAGMNARGVIEVIIATVGLRLGVLSTQMYTIIVMVAIVTSLMAPPILRLAMNRVEPTTEERLRAAIAEHTDGKRGE